MRYKNDKNIKFVITRFVFKLKMHQNPFSAAGGAYDAPPDPLVGWDPFPSLLDAFGVSNSAPGASVLRPPQHKILATPVRDT